MRLNTAVSTDRPVFHTYFRLQGVEDPLDPSVTVSPLKGLALVDKVADAAHSTEDRDALVFDGEVDRVYEGAPSTLKLSYGKSGLELSTVNLPDVVVWNPHKAKVRRSRRLATDRRSRTRWATWRRTAGSAVRVWHARQR